MSPLQNEIHLTGVKKNADLKRLHSKLLTVFKYYALYIKYNFGTEFVTIICYSLFRYTFII